MGFVYKYSGSANAGRVLREYTLTDSGTYTEGDAMKLASGKLDLVGANTPVFGILVGFKKADGSLVTTNGAGGAYTNTYTTGASNTILGVVDVSTESVYSVTADATLGTTTGSNLAGYNLDVVAASDQLDESTAVTLTAQFFSWGVDPDPKAPSNSVLVSIQESQVKL